MLSKQPPHLDNAVKTANADHDHDNDQDDQDDQDDDDDGYMIMILTKETGEEESPSLDDETSLMIASPSRPLYKIILLLLKQYCYDLQGLSCVK